MNTANRVAGFVAPCIFADEVRAAGRFKEALAGLVDLDWSRCGILGSDLARQHVGIDASGVMVPARFPTGRIVDSNHRECLVGDVGKFLRADQLDIVACRRLSRPELAPMRDAQTTSNAIPATSR